MKIFLVVREHSSDEDNEYFTEVVCAKYIKEEAHAVAGKFQEEDTSDSTFYVQSTMLD